MGEEFTAALLAVADDPAGLDRLVELAESGDVEAVAEGDDEDDLAESASGPKGPPPFPGAVFDPGRHRWVRGAGSEEHIAAMKRRQLQQVAMQVGAPTTLKMDEPIETLRANILASTGGDTTNATAVQSASPAGGKPGYVGTPTPQQVQSGRDRVIAAKADPKAGDDAPNITDDRFAAVADDIVAAVVGHSKRNNQDIGPSVAALYAAVGPNHGLTPAEFRGAVQRLRQSGRVRTSGMSKTLSDEPRPDLLLVPQSGTPQAWVHPPSSQK